MLIWFAIDVNDQPLDIRKKTESLTGELGLTNPALTLPLHISLRISCPVSDHLFHQLVERVVGYFAELDAFPVSVSCIEQQGGIVWIKMQENEELRSIHRKLVELLQQEFGVLPEPFDHCFLYHTTLFQGEQTQAEKFCEGVKEERPPAVVHARKLVIGCSRSGKAGDYRVIREIAIK